ncbi:MAG: NHL repeat-containing protein [Bacteroidota bacterium]
MKNLLMVLAVLLFVAGCKKNDSSTQPTQDVPPWDNGQSAEAVFGQTTLTGTGSNTVSQSSVNNPWGMVTDNNGSLFVVDQGAHRILRFDSAATKANGANANGVLGQPNFTSSGWNYSANGNTPSAQGFQTPTSVAIDGSGNLYVVDQANGRVLRFNAAGSRANGAAADGVLGRPDFTSTGFGTTQSTFFTPQAIAVDPSGNLYVADGSNHRVLRFNNAALKANGANADGVLGQINFTTNTKGTAADKLDNPISLATDKNGNLYVGQKGNYRLSIFLNAAAKANGASADIVLGKSDFTDGTVPAASQSSIYFAYALAVDQNNNLYVADGYYNRCLVFYNAPSKSNGGLADAVLGKPDFTSASATGGTAVNIGQPYGVAVQSSTGKLYLSCFSNSRFLRFQAKSSLHR